MRKHAPLLLGLAAVSIVAGGCHAHISGPYGPYGTYGYTVRAAPPARAVVVVPPGHDRHRRDRYRVVHHHVHDRYCGH